MLLFFFCWCNCVISVYLCIYVFELVFLNGFALSRLHVTTTTTTKLLLSKLAGSNPAEAVGFFRAKKVLSTPSFGREVKPFVPCRRFTACKNP